MEFTGSHYHTITPNTVYVVMIDDYGDYIPQKQVDSLWEEWKDAANRVALLNKQFAEDIYSDCHAHYESMLLNHRRVC